MLTRRYLLRHAAVGLLLAGASPRHSGLAQAADAPVVPESLPAGAVDAAVLHALPGKRPLIKRTFRPPNYETPLALFNEPFTPNDAFFVRYHLMHIPEVPVAEWHLTIDGDAVTQPTRLSMHELITGFEQVEVAAVCQCSGNRRGLFQPHVPGVQWGHGAMGHAVWRGVRLKDVLAKVGLKSTAVEIVCDGADGGVLVQTPDFRKSLPVWKALEEHTLIAVAMNGAPLPHWNGAPARLVVPGWTATYWIKQLTALQVVSTPFDGFWMKTAYRIPTGVFPLVDRFLSQETATTTPITEMVVNSLITNLTPAQRLETGQMVDIAGIAWDGGYGIQRVEVSVDAGASWREATLGQDLGRYAWRQWHYPWRATQPGQHVIRAKATNRIGATQTFALLANPAGYHHNVVQHLPVTVG